MCLLKEFYQPILTSLTLTILLIGCQGTDARIVWGYEPPKKFALDSTYINSRMVYELEGKRKCVTVKRRLNRYALADLMHKVDSELLRYGWHNALDSTFKFEIPVAQQGAFSMWDSTRIWINSDSKF